MESGRLCRMTLKYIRCYPASRAVDIYKLLYQAIMGGVHIIGKKGAKEAFIREYADVKPDKTLPLLEPIRPDNALARVHLAAARYREINTDKIWEAVEKSARLWIPDEKFLREFLSYFATINSDFACFFAGLDLSNLVPMHHSEIYTRTYNPHYRIVIPELMENNI